MSRFGHGFIFGGNTGNDAFTKILLHMDGANGGTVFADDNAPALAHAWTAHSATTNTGTVKFGSASLNCGASAGYIDTPDSADFTLGSGDWTYDFWFNVQGSSGAVRYACGQYDGTTASVVGGCDINNKLFFQIHNGGFIGMASATAITSAGWHHAACTKSGTTARLFLDGVQEASATVTGSVTDMSGAFAVGRAGTFAGSLWNGFIDEFRLSVGIARWTANFTPPAGPYT